MHKKAFTNEVIKDEYNKFSKFYDYFNLPFNIFLLARLRKKLLGDLKGKVLETAVGSGENLKYYNRSCKLSAIDLSPGMLELAKKEAKRLGIGVKFYIGEAERLPFSSGNFDYVVDSLALCNYIDPVKVLKEIKRVCKKNGRILLLEHGKSNNTFLSKFQNWRERRRGEKFGCALTRNHEQLVRKAGLKIEKIERHMFGIFYLIHVRNL
ncbi:MAG: methyltransferase domain-containing protein [Nanoarchaeota archaeon]